MIAKEKSSPFNALSTKSIHTRVQCYRYAGESKAVDNNKRARCFPLGSSGRYSQSPYLQKCKVSWLLLCGCRACERRARLVCLLKLRQVQPAAKVEAKKSVGEFQLLQAARGSALPAQAKRNGHTQQQRSSKGEWITGKQRNR